MDKAGEKKIPNMRKMTSFEMWQNGHFGGKIKMP